MTIAPGTLALAKGLSQNAKLGDAATTYAAQTSCPAGCPFFESGCYAETGAVGMFVTGPLNRAAGEVPHDPVDVAHAEAAAIDDLEVPAGRPLRLHTVGDCSSDEAARIVAAAAERYMARGGGPVWTYTHAWRDVARASWGAVSVLASCETTHDVGLAGARGYATALVVEEFAAEQRHRIGAAPSVDAQGGADVLPCPSQTRGVHCTDCRLCFDDEALRERGYSIGFELHGIPLAIRQARLALAGDPDRRVPSLERIREIRDRILAERGLEPTVADVRAELDLNVTSIYEWLRYLRGEIIHPAERRRRARQRSRARPREDMAPTEQAV